MKGRNAPSPGFLDEDAEAELLVRRQRLSITTDDSTELIGHVSKRHIGSDKSESYVHDKFWVGQLQVNNWGDDFLLRIGPASTSMFLTDALGSLVATTDSAGGVQSDVTYEPFGNTEMSSPAPAYRFTGREHDEPLYLYYYRARYYHTDLQRFISEDPIGFAGDDSNLYAYVANNPIRHTDALGLKLDLEYAGSLVGALQRVRSTPRGAQIFDALERSPDVYRIRETAGIETTHYDPYTREIVVNTVRPSVVCTTAGRKPMPREASLAHEGGHAVGFLDAGNDNMDNVNANENPVREKLGYPVRLTYGGTKCPP